MCALRRFATTQMFVPGFVSRGVTRDAEVWLGLQRASPLPRRLSLTLFFSPALAGAQSVEMTFPAPESHDFMLLVEESLLHAAPGVWAAGDTLVVPCATSMECATSREKGS